MVHQIHNVRNIAIERFYESINIFRHVTGDKEKRYYLYFHSNRISYFILEQTA